MKEISLVEVVKEFGTEKQISCVIKGNKWRKESHEALMKVLNSKYEIVAIKGKGYKMVFTLGREYSSDKDIPDGRTTNGKGQVPVKYEQAFTIMVIEHLIHRISGEPLTVNKWLKNIGIITEEMFQASKLRYSFSTLEEESNKLFINNVIESGEEYLVDDYVKREIERLQKYFMNVIRKLVKAKLITHQTFKMAKCEVPNVGKRYDEKHDAFHTEYIELTPDVVNKIAKMERNLQNSFQFKELTLDEIRRYRNKSIVKEYWKEHKKQLNLIDDEEGNRLYIVLSYEAHALCVKASINPIINWLEKNNKEALASYNIDKAKFILENRVDFHGALCKYVEDLAEGRQDNFQKKSVNLLGGKLNLHKFDDNKYKIAQHLMNKGMYAKAYRKLHEYYGINIK